MNYTILAVSFSRWLGTLQMKFVTQLKSNEVPFSLKTAPQPELTPRYQSFHQQLQSVVQISFGQ
jgi:hypothetical protein